MENKKDFDLQNDLQDDTPYISDLIKKEYEDYKLDDLTDKTLFLDYIINASYCSVSMFLENVNENVDVARQIVWDRLEKLTTPKQIKAFMHEYI